MTKKLQVLQNEEVISPLNIKTITNSNGTAIQFPDGTMICTQRATFNNVPQNFKWGSLYRTNPLALPDYPVAFTEVYAKTVSTNADGFGWGALGVSKNTSAGDLYLVQPNSANSVSFTADIIAIGKWKSRGGV